jgi:hypothetical protein
MKYATNGLPYCETGCGQTADIDDDDDLLVTRSGLPVCLQCCLRYLNRGEKQRSFRQHYKRVKFTD